MKRTENILVILECWLQLDLNGKLQVYNQNWVIYRGAPDVISGQIILPDSEKFYIPVSGQITGYLFDSVF